MIADHIEETNVGSEGTINKEELCKSINIVKSLVPRLARTVTWPVPALVARGRQMK